MSLLSDREICEYAINKDMIIPYIDKQIKEVDHEEKKIKVVSYGLGSYGYDIRLSGKRVDIFKRVEENWFKKFCKSMFSFLWIDPKSDRWQEREEIIDKIENIANHEKIVIPPNSFLLGESLETINVPKDILVLCIGKSTYARCGIIVNVTPLEPEWRGKITIEISNTTPLPAVVYAGEGIAQLIFFKGNQTCNTSYDDRSGKYQDQKGLEYPKL